MQRVAKELHVSNFNDVAALVALFRPGPIDSGMLQQYIDAKNGAEVHYPCKAVEELAGNTFGVLVYQEQVMKISMRMAGYSLGQADMLRKVIGRKEITKINQAVKDFVEACVANGYEESVAQSPTESEHKTGIIPGLITEDEITRKEDSDKKKKPSGSSKLARWTRKITNKFNAGCDSMLDFLEDEKENKEE